MTGEGSRTHCAECGEKVEAVDVRVRGGIKSMSVVPCGHKWGAGPRDV